MNKTEAVVTDNHTKEKEKTAKRNREDKHRKKDDKSVDHVLKALSSLETTEEKLGAMCQKYAEIFNDHRILQNAAKVAEKKNSVLQKEKEQLQAEHSKAILTRSRLENLCRELQRQNKAVKEECMLKIREEEEKKREVAAKFQSTLTELGNLLAQNNDKNAKLRDDNLDMTTKLKNVCEQYEKKEQHVEKMAKQMHLEMQLANTKLAKAKMEMALEKEELLRDNQQLLLELKEYKKQLEEMKTSEIALRSQIQLYNDKYDEFHKALLQSNDAIGSFKQEMERMAKQIRKLEKETVAWKRRYETTHRTLLQMTEEKIKSDETASVSERRLTALQGLCRTLQAQNNHLRGVMKTQTNHGSSNTSGTAEATLVTAPLEFQVTETVCGTENNLQMGPNDTTCDSEVINGHSLMVHEEHIAEEDNRIVNTEEDCDSQTLKITNQNDTIMIEEVAKLEVHNEDDIDLNTNYEVMPIIENGNIDDTCDHLVIVPTEMTKSTENTKDIIDVKAEISLQPHQSGINENGICPVLTHELKGDSSSTTIEIPPSNDRILEQVIQPVLQDVNDETKLLVDTIAATEKIESTRQPPPVNQQQGKKNKGKRKKSGATTIIKS